MAKNESVSRYVPAWQVQTGSYSIPDYVHILTPELDEIGWPRTKLVHRLTPMDKDEQLQLQKVNPQGEM